MKQIAKRVLAMLVAVLLALPMPAFSEGAVPGKAVNEGNAVAGQGIEPSGEEIPGETGGESAKAGDGATDGEKHSGETVTNHSVEPSVNEVGGELGGDESALPGQADPEQTDPPAEAAGAAFEQSVTLDDATVTVTAGAGVFPEGVSLSAGLAEDADICATLEALIGEAGVYTHRLYRVQVLDEAENAVLPDFEQGAAVVRVEGLNLPAETRVAMYDEALEGVLELSAVVDVEGNAIEFNLENVAYYDIFTIEPQTEQPSADGADPVKENQPATEGTEQQPGGEGTENDQPAAEGTEQQPGGEGMENDQPATEGTEQQPGGEGTENDQPATEGNEQQPGSEGTENGQPATEGTEQQSGSEGTENDQPATEGTEQQPDSEGTQQPGGEGADENQPASEGTEEPQNDVAPVLLGKRMLMGAPALRNSAETQYTITFTCTPADATVVVYRAGSEDPITAEADGSYLLPSGIYRYKAEAAGYIASDDTKSAFEVTDSDQEINVTLEDDESTQHADIDSWEALQQEINDAKNGDRIILSDNVYSTDDDDEALTITDDDKWITLDLNGNNIDRKLSEAKDDGCVICVNGGHLILVDEAGTGTIQGGWNTENGGGIVVKSGSLKVNGAQVSNNKTDKNGGGVYVNADCMFTFLRGVIENNEASEKGGGIYHEVGSSVAMKGGFVYMNEPHDVCLHEPINISGTIEIEKALITKDSEALYRLLVEGPLSSSSRIGFTMSEDFEGSNVVVTSGLNGRGVLENFKMYDTGDMDVALNADGEVMIGSYATIRLYSDDGRTGYETRKAMRGTQYAMPECPFTSATGQPFQGWRMEDVTVLDNGKQLPAGSVVQAGDKIVIPDTGDVTATATWGIDWAGFQALIDNAGYGDTIDLPCDLTREGRHLCQWRRAGREGRFHRRQDHRRQRRRRRRQQRYLHPAERRRDQWQQLRQPGWRRGRQCRHVHPAGRRGQRQHRDRWQGRRRRRGRRHL